MKKITKSLLLLILLILSNFIHGQNNLEDVIYLKNGSIIRGIIIEQIPNQSLKIQTKDRSVFVFKFEEIEKMTKESQPNNKKTNGFSTTELKKRGFINITEINISSGIGQVKVGKNKVDNTNNSFGFRTVNGFQINRYISVGVGVGIDKYKSVTYLPISFDARISILKGKFSPVFIANIGYALGLNNVKSGLCINPQIGIRKYISKNIAYLFNFGYKLQPQEITYLQPKYIQTVSGGVGSILTYYTNETTTVNYGYLTISTGLSF